MKKLIAVITGMITIAGFVVHVWTIIIAFKQSGFFAALLTFIIPFISEVYWMIKMWSINNTYAVICLVSLIVGSIIGLLSKIGGR